MSLEKNIEFSVEKANPGGEAGGGGFTTAFS
jgi:hypothetical protein